MRTIFFDSCPPVPSNLPPGCIILQPSHSLPYPSCCPTPSCPPLGEHKRLPRWRLALPPRVHRSNQPSPRSEAANVLNQTYVKQPVVKIEESVGKIGISNASHRTQTSLRPNATSLFNNETDNIHRDTDRLKIVLNTDFFSLRVNSTIKQKFENESYNGVDKLLQSAPNSNVDPKMVETKDFQEALVPIQQTQKIIDILVGKDSGVINKNIDFHCDYLPNINNKLRNESFPPIAENDSLKNTFHHANNSNTMVLEEERNTASNSSESSIILTDDAFSNANKTMSAAAQQNKEIPPLNTSDSQMKFKFNDAVSLLFDSSVNATRAIDSEIFVETNYVNVNNYSGIIAGVNGNLPDQITSKIVSPGILGNKKMSEKYKCPQKSENGTIDNLCGDQVVESSSILEMRQKSLNLPSTRHSNLSDKNSKESIPKVNIVETRPNYVKLFSLIRKASGNDTDLTKIYNLISKAIIPNNLQTNEALTLAIVSEAIGNGLNTIMRNRLTKNDDKLNNLQLLKSNETFDAKQSERTRRNTAIHKHAENEIDGHEAEKKKPVFFIPWKKIENKNNVSEDTELRKNIPAVPSGTLEITTQSSQQKNLKTPYDIGNFTNMTTRRNTSELISDQNKAESILVTTTAPGNNSKPSRTRHSKSRMTIPRIPPNRTRTANRTKLNQKLSKFTSTAYATVLEQQLTDSAKAPNETLSTASSDVDPIPSGSGRRKFRSRRLKLPDLTTATYSNSSDSTENAIVPKEDPVTGKMNQPASEREGRLNRIRNRLLSRRRSTSKLPEVITESNKVNSNPSGSATVQLDNQTTNPPEVLKMSTVGAEEIQPVAIQDTTLPVLKIDNSNTSKEQYKEVAEQNLTKNSSLPKNVHRSLSSRLRFQNMINPRKRNKNESIKTQLPKTSSKPPTINNVVELNVDIPSANNVIESNVSQNNIEDTNKDGAARESVVNQVPARRKPSLENRARLLKLIRDRGENRNNAKQLNDINVKEKYKHLKIENEVDKSPVLPNEIQKIPIQNISSKKATLTSTQSLTRQRLNPKPVTGIIQVSEKPTVRSLAPIRVTHSPQLFQKIATLLPAPSIKEATLPQQSIRTQTRRKHPTVQSTNKRRQEIVPNKVVQNLHKNNSPNVHLPNNQNLHLVSNPNINPVINSNVNVVSNLNLNQPNQHLYHAPPSVPQQNQPQNQHQTQAPKVYYPINQLVNTIPTNQNVHTQQVSQQPQTQAPNHNNHNQHTVYQPNQLLKSNQHNHKENLHNPHKTPTLSKNHPTAQNEPKKEDSFSLLPTVHDFPEMKDDFEPHSFDFEVEDDFNYKEPQFVIDYRNKNKDTFNSDPKKLKPTKPKIPEGAKVTEEEYFVEGPSGVPIKVTTVTFHTSKSSVRNENVKNRSSHFKRDPFGEVSQ